MTAREDILVIAIQQLSESNEIAMTILQRNCLLLPSQDLDELNRSIELMNLCQQSLREFMMVNLRREAIQMAQHVN